MDELAIRRMRAGLWVSWVLAGLVPIGIVGGFLVGQHVSSPAGITMLIAAMAAEVIGPPIAIAIGFHVRRRAMPAVSTGRAWVAVAFYAVALVLLAVGVSGLVGGAKAGSMGLGLAIGGLMAGVGSVVPWLVSVVVGSVWTSRLLRDVSPK
ncbi:MAG: hypothetical protein AAF799_40625 [Myxococcota bacterium]